MRPSDLQDERGARGATCVRRPIRGDLQLALTGEPDPPYEACPGSPAGATGPCGPAEGISAHSPAASHLPAALWIGIRLLVSALVLQYGLDYT